MSSRPSPWCSRSRCPEKRGIIMAAWTLPPELDQPLPRLTKRRSSFVFLLVFQLGIFGLLILLMAWTTGSTYYNAQTLKERGIQATGTVTKLVIRNGKGGPSYEVSYLYPAVPKPAYTATDYTNL